LKVEQLEPGASRPVTLQAILRAEATGLPFLVVSPAGEGQRIVVLEGSDEVLWIGRSPACDIPLEGDGLASRTHAELVRTVESLHNLNLQRCDRVTMAHGLEARVPFLDREVIEWALRLPPGFKLAGPGQPEKRLLREAFDGWLPDALLWRDKAEFGDGSGAKDVLTAAIESEITLQELELERDLVVPPLRTREELAYFRIFREHLTHVRPELTLSRFATA